MEEKIELLPCPFCGGEAEMDTRRAYRNISTGQLGDAVAIYCLGCSADMNACRADHTGLEVEDLIRLVSEMWNRRPSSPSRERVEVLEEALTKALRLKGGWREAIVELEDFCSEPVRLKNMIAAADQLDEWAASARAILAGGKTDG